MAFRDPTTMCRRACQGAVLISYYFMRRKRFLLCRARTKPLCNYPRKVLKGENAWDKSCTVIVFSSSDRALYKDEIGGSMDHIIYRRIVWRDCSGKINEKILQ